jgi:hypothetical protein
MPSNSWITGIHSLFDNTGVGEGANVEVNVGVKVKVGEEVRVAAGVDSGVRLDSAVNDATDSEVSSISCDRHPEKISGRVTPMTLSGISIVWDLIIPTLSIHFRPVYAQMQLCLA